MGTRLEPINLCSNGAGCGPGADSSNYSILGHEAGRRGLLSQSNDRVRGLGLGLGLGVEARGRSSRAARSLDLISAKQARHSKETGIPAADGARKAGKRRHGGLTLGGTAAWVPSGPEWGR
jgi:hypothetical protein